MEDAFIGAGSNLGDRFLTLRKAVSMLKEVARTNVLATSSVYESEAHVLPGQEHIPPFLNLVVQVRTELHPAELLAALLEIEHACGRVRETRWGPRTLDLDLLAHGSARCITPHLELPHPRVRERRFVLEPWAEIAPDWEVAGWGRVRTLLHACPDTSRLAVVSPPF